MNINIGDTIGIIALSGDCDKEKVEQAKANIEALGYKVILSKNIFDKNRYLAGSDEDKVNELEGFFKNPEIKLILCARGGYGAIRIINKIDYEIIKANPKPFCGFSDVTALLLMIYKKTGIITYHAPMAQTDFLSDVTPFWEEALSKSYEIIKSYKKGNVSGILWGGNLSTVVSLCGQDFIPNEDFIFFAEDLNEPVYKIDKMFQQLINLPDFLKNCRAIVLGDFLDTDNDEWLEEYFSELADRLNIPVVHMEGITHSEYKITLPIGADARIENNKFIL